MHAATHLPASTHKAMHHPYSFCHEDTEKLDGPERPTTRDSIKALTETRKRKLAQSTRDRALLNQAKRRTRTHSPLAAPEKQHCRDPRPFTQSTGSPVILTVNTDARFEPGTPEKPEDPPRATTNLHRPDCVLPSVSDPKPLLLHFTLGITTLHVACALTWRDTDPQRT